ncbi:MAG: hypothetical protein UV58_C0007G0006 [Candidatus Wolfebacteria bacterium GW2011_GWC1_43_10]|uniref:Uncharacterized protein n=2 Tax=Candidatus Wolfeibacteriota TaxID=1752735 RepID=A0A0G1CAU6_9BACT|nr:MAG: hypothetical protein UV58_C0007G0006 [Candidatus Wolfebacteria bacterium GW2011_GWC1_43_10]KKT22672.1 MAG: hypothetical protein UW08_C0005G0047 [Parcubacteria group bacterium GW2011_GWB1_43_8b]OGM90095.1 MAG: hypothetical protein A2108_00410 [Candidatus Wolfebacteria bacterium GWA1_42_9]
MAKTQIILDKNPEIILEELGIKNLSPEEEKEVINTVLEHFNKVIIETVILNLDDNQVDRFKAALERNNFEEEITKITAAVPGLADKIEKAVEDEFALLKKAKGIVS